MQSLSLKQLADLIGATIHLSGNDTEDTQINSLSTLANAGIGQISFLSNSKYRSDLADTRAQAVILHPDELSNCPCTALVHANPYVGFALIAQALDSTPDAASGIHPSAVIADDVIMGDNVSVGAQAVIETGVVLGDNVQIGAGSFVGKNCRLGSQTKIWANVTLYHNTIMGENCLVQSATVIGSDGFGYANEKGKWIKIPQLGRVVIGDRVEIGASTTIDRGALEDTIIADGVIIDNQIQIAHNVEIGENTAMAACSVIAGSTKVGKNCSVAGLCGFNGHIEICDNSHFTGMSMVTKSVTEPGLYSSGIPAVPNLEWRKNAVQLKKISSIAQRVKVLEKQQTTK
ncbi:UDP-3-O-(3-hydroxymyristoyl)glucosamine N-acyltransferase [Aliiglaciecola sp. SL4]|uniref:UDP-3-O-(3-hydroxymyristoyl)glucosamine N-acyltransferase n=1 Tax=Aliiglaciecola sp. SL4 TaxID=3239806 RepID=UPI00355C1315